MLMAVILAGNISPAWAAPDPDMVLPPRIAALFGVEPAAIVIPHDLGRPPVPPRKPRASTPTSPKIARAAWDRGLQAYRTQDFNLALKAFVQAYENGDKKDAWTQGASAFWAARTADKLGQAETAREYRIYAAQYDRTFYGQLAQAQLGETTRISWELPIVPQAAQSAFHQDSRAKLAATHLAAGRLSAADEVLQGFARERDAGMRLAALNYAIRHHLPATALRLAPGVERENEMRINAAMYPVGRWMARSDFRVDPALVHAIIRQESSFNPRARSHQGAVGLMQLLPSTARYVVKVRAHPENQMMDLTRSTHNLAVGQEYLAYLLDRPMVQGDILNMLMAYNAGPGNLARWQRDLDDVGDELLFIEMIPAAETRAYVEKVMAAYWIYQDRFGTNPTTRTRIAGGVDSVLPMSSARVIPASTGPETSMVQHMRRYFGL